MSAFIVPAYHVNALVSWAADRHGHRAVSYVFVGRRRDVRGAPARVASVLYAENVRSVNARYNEAERADGFRYKRVSTSHLKPADIVNACNCLDYQSCETSDWRETEARAIVDAIRDEAVRDLCEGSAVWCLDAPETAARRA
jgi:hypothetical protein